MVSPVLRVLRLLETGDHSGLEQYLSADDIELEETDQEGWSALFHSVQQNNLPFVSSLLERGSNPNKTDLAGRSPLVLAVSISSLQIVRCLLTFGADVSQADCESWTGLLAACYLGHQEIVETLLAAGADISQHGRLQCSGLAWAAGRGHLSTVRTLIKHQADIDCGDKFGTSPLIWAVRGGHSQVVEELLRAGARVDTVGMYAWTSLVLAARSNHQHIVKLLLSHSPPPNVNVVDKDGFTALAIACKEGNLNIVHQLISHGAHINLQDRAGDTNLVLASKNGHSSVVDFLLRRHSDLDTRGKENKTALYNAVEKNHVEVVRLLLSSGPDLEAVASDGNTALLRAVKNRNPHIVSLLIEKKAKLNACDKKGDTSLHVAMRAGSKTIVEIILRNPKHAQLLYRPNQKGETPYNIDMSSGKPILSQLLGTRQLNTNENTEGLLAWDLYGSALAQILAEPELSLPITVGLYAKWGSGKSLLLNKLQKEMKNFSKDWVEPSFTFSPFCFIILLHLTGLVGLLYWMTSHFLNFDWSLVLTGLVMAAVLLASYSFLFLLNTNLSSELECVGQMKSSVSNLLNQLELLTKILFCRPPGRSWRSSQGNAAPLRHFFTDQTKVSGSAGGEDTVTQMVGTLLDSLEQTYGKFTTRLFRAVGAQPESSSSSLSFRTFAGIPYVLLYLLTFALGWLEITLIILSVENSLAEGAGSVQAVTEQAVHVMLVFCSSILALIFLVKLRTIVVLVRSLFTSQRSHLITATENTEILRSEGIIQAVRNELAFLVRMVESLDGFTDRHSRLTIIVDGLDIIEQRKVLQVLDTVHYLFSDPGHPFIILIAIDPHIIIKAIELNINEAFADTSVGGFAYLRNVIHLPFFLQSSGTQRIKIAQNLAAGRNKDLASADSEARLRSQARLISESNENVLGKVGSAARLAGPLEINRMFLTDDYFSDVNPRSMRRLMNVLYVMGRLLKAFKIDFNWHHLSVWINVTEQWPYRASWMIHSIEQSEGDLESHLPLLTVYQNIKDNIPKKIDASFNDMDRDEEKLRIFLQIHKKILTVKTIMIFFPFTINLDPYIRKIIQEYINQRHTHTVGGLPSAKSSPLEWLVKMKNHRHHLQPPEQNWQTDQRNVIPSGHRHSLLSSLSVTEVSGLLDQIVGLTVSGIEMSREIIIKQNINGKVLNHCDLRELKEVFSKVSFGDWEMLKTLILEMRKTCPVEQQGNFPQPGLSVNQNINKNSSVLEQLVLEREAVSGLVSNINEDAKDQVEMEEPAVPERPAGGKIGQIYYSSTRSIADLTTSSRSISKLSIEETEGATNDNFLLLPKHPAPWMRRNRSKSENPPEFDEHEEIEKLTKVSTPPKDNKEIPTFYLDAEDESDLN